MFEQVILGLVSIYCPNHTVEDNFCIRPLGLTLG